MTQVRLKKHSAPLSGTLSFPGDKSLSHRAIIFGSLSEGISSFKNVLSGEDCVCTREAFEAMGVDIKSSSDGTEVVIIGKGLHGLKEPKKELYLGNSGTSMRILSGVLAGQPFKTTLTGDPSLSSRPMKRVTSYLRQMGAVIEGRDDGNFAPLTIKGGKLKPIDVSLAVSSAQVKSAILLAGLYANGTTSVTEPVLSRDHTELFLRYFGANIKQEGLKVSIAGGQTLNAKSFEIPGDISSAAFFMAIAILLKDSAIKFQNILFNETRIGIVKVLERMGAPLMSVGHDKLGRPEMMADFSLMTQKLRGTEVMREELPSLIDEIPILCVLATQAQGKTVIHDADELRVKETDRIDSMITALSLMGAKIKSEKNTILIEGPTPLKGAVVDSRKDHRTAMSLIVAGLIAEGEQTVKDVDCINTSFPTFFKLLDQLKISYQL